MNFLKYWWDLFVETYKSWSASPASNYSASLAYNAIFAMPGLLIIIIWIAGNIFGQEAIQGEITHQFSGVMGAEVAKSIEEMIASAWIDKQNFWMKAIGVGSLIYGSTNLFFQLQKALNELWEIEAAPRQAILKFILDRANSLGMILIIGFLMMIMMMISTLVSLLNGYITSKLGLETYYLMEIVNYVVGFFAVILIFAFMFKVLPDVDISWKSVWSGSILTAILFTLGKFLLGLYFEKAQPTSAFGAAGTIILIMMWINYSCLLVFFGAEFTKVYTYKKGYRIAPSKDAKWMAEKLYRDEQLAQTTNKKNP